MTTDTIDHKTLAHLVEAHAVRGTCVVGQPGGWGVIVQYGTIKRPLAATRSREVRVFKELDTLVGYLKEMGIHRFEVNAVDFDPQSVATYTRPDASAALKRAHAAAAHDQWFREQVAQAIEEAEDPSTQWVSNEAAKAESAQRQAMPRGVFDPRLASQSPSQSLQAAQLHRSGQSPGNGRPGRGN